MTHRKDDTASNHASDQRIFQITAADLEEAVGRAMDAKLGKFYVDQEKHYQDHQFIQEWRKWTDNIKGTVLGVAVKTIMAGLIGLLVLGFILWGRKNIVP